MISSLLIVIATACEKGIDPISSVAPGTDESAPELTINFPLEGTLIRVTEAIATINIKVEAVDDIELKDVKLQMDGTEIASFNTFKDYRRAMLTYSYNNVTDGEHTLTVVATDLTGKNISKSVNFKKVAPYAALDGEVFYMPFDGDYVELVSVNEAEVHGAPSFVDGKVGKAYKGATDAYLSFPSAGLLGGEFSTSFWYKLDGTPKRGGLLAISPVGDSRSVGFRMAREDNGANQNLFVNFGITDSEVWMNPFITVAPSDSWMHIVVSISGTEANIYVNDQLVKTAPITTPIDWTGCSSISIGSGMPNFGYWEHYSDLSQYDELRIFTKALSADEVHSIYTMK